MAVLKDGSGRLAKKVWGYEQILVNKDFCFKVMYVKPRSRSSIHRHAKKDELFYILRGPLVFEFGKRIVRMSHKVVHEGDMLRIRPGTWHRFTNFGSGVTKFLEASTHDDPRDSQRTSPSRCGF